MSEFVYFISDGELVKIGRAKDVGNRVKMLQTGSSRRLEVMHVIEHGQPHELEAHLHNRFAAKRGTDEWFALTASDVDEVKAEDWAKVQFEVMPHRKRGQGLTKEETLQVFQSAVGYCREAGLQPKFVNRDGGLWLWLPGAELVTNAEGKAVVRLVAHAPEVKDGIVKFRADVERIGEELATMRAANVELQERLSRLKDDGK